MARASALRWPSVTSAAWQQVPSTYLVCAADRNTSPALQRDHAARAGRTVELPTGHHPFLSRPDLVAAAITEVIEHASGAHSARPS